MSRPLQNRVTPFGDLIATPARGTLTGNRGRLHDPGQRVVRRVAGGYRAWVTCLLAFRGRHRAVMAPNRYTELFFLDEATALAAGHRPCGECRRPDFLRFKAAWLAANPIGASARTSSSTRSTASSTGTGWSPTGGPRTHTSRSSARSPTGSFVVLPDAVEALLVWRGSLAPWSPAGYGAPRPSPRGEQVRVQTPRSTVAAIAAGYVPGVHPSLADGRAAGTRLHAVVRPRQAD